jgi:hypothetical protein
VALPLTPGVTDAPIALAASVWVTTEQELKLAVLVVAVVVAPVVVVGAVVDGDPVVVGAVLDDVEGDELHAARRMAAGTATTIPTMPGRSFGCSLIRPLGRIAGRDLRRSVVLWDLFLG